MIYLIICLFILILVYIEVIERSRLLSAFFGGIVCLTMVLFASLRHEVGTDWFSYYDFYKFKTYDVEAGYAIINNYFSDNNIPYNWFLFFLNLISLLLIYFSLKRYAYFFIISLLLFYSELFLYLNFSGIRQAMAISITVLSIKYAIERKFIRFLILVSLAATFHITSIIFVAAYFIPFRKFNKKEILILGFGFIFISAVIFKFMELLSGDLAYKLKFYLELQENAPNLKILFAFGALRRSIVLIVILIFGRQLFKLENGTYFFNIYLIGYAMYLSTYLISPDIGVRMSSYFLIFEIFLAGQLIIVNRQLTNRLIIASIFAIVSVYKVYTYMNLEPYNYQSILSF